MLPRSTPMLKRKYEGFGPQKFPPILVSSPPLGLNRRIDEMAMPAHGPGLTHESAQKRRKKLCQLVSPQLGLSFVDTAISTLPTGAFTRPQEVFQHVLEEHDDAGACHSMPFSGSTKRPLVRQFMMVANKEPLNLTSICSQRDSHASNSLDTNFREKRSINVHSLALLQPPKVPIENSPQIPSLKSSPCPNFAATIQTPHEPRYPISKMPASIRQEIAIHNELNLFTLSDFFQNHLEERLMRWRPSESQQNVDDALRGPHPFQTLNDQENVQPNSFLALLKDWFSKDLKTTAQTLPLPLSIVPPHDLRDTDLIQAIGALRMNPNTSDSILQRVLPAYLAAHSVALQMTPTPLAFPLAELQLENALHPSVAFYRSLASRSEFREIYEDVEDFFVSCARDFWESLVGAVSYCHGSA
ncbi:uncharacterized protein CANTADRAFT_3633 [Suhomyces tanzawaensis NRRL Y-17324]|uniref:Uncharacterized protein n=1 Tax=Suhomyces tanzawaensis NRRL Y-17324 TaxID=984487 RepID=A0A1E4SQ28_9ASCO|nr:uncharacterized protein CANTADRAFT_3633 [Suhomyces tanzawaensis NRRL Y-17324]ODV81537.1 hypothetical protein CANTADRAFT_3633 [Suhomyces tanzawaensis NRRL Y-17324]